MPYDRAVNRTLALSQGLFGEPSENRQRDHRRQLKRRDQEEKGRKGLLSGLVPEQAPRPR